jgi:hypothetical protein
MGMVLTLGSARQVVRDNSIHPHVHVHRQSKQEAQVSQALEHPVLGRQTKERGRGAGNRL